MLIFREMTSQNCLELPIFNVPAVRNWNPIAILWASRPLWNLSWQTHPWGDVRKSCWYPEWNIGKRVRAGCRSVSHQWIGCRCDHGNEWADWKPVEGDEENTNGILKQHLGDDRAISEPSRAWKAGTMLCHCSCSASPSTGGTPALKCFARCYFTR